MKNKARGVIETTFHSNLSEIVFKAILPEIVSGSNGRYRGKLKRDGDIISLEIEAEDTVALRAALNSYLRWLKIIYDINEIT
ncbi:MAG: KEOPS complex subunit Pcc1 [Candidatus Jordarchaeum sp.]|uniref:KEOPS complex subunit Pcc1 n=1 Tax=Candidatus Jordarchaeum sp. TaxID=2823881 RepID=UPI004049B6FB